MMDGSCTPFYGAAYAREASGHANQPSERKHSRFALPQMLLSLAPLPLIAAAASVGTLRSLSGQYDWAPFVYAILLFLASLSGLGASVWPYAIPGVLNIWDASSEHRTQVISFFAFAGVVPVILAYVGFSY
jgi:cytochrome bd ubiquinol oxidase subunit II